MPRCPTCGRPFEAGVQFCPDDGSRLVADAPAAPVGASPYAPPPYVPTPVAAPASKALPIIVGVLVVAVVGLAGVLLWQQQQTVEVVVAQPAAPVPPVQNTPIQQPVPLPVIPPPPSYRQIVYANSPRDGYLVLRQGPRAARGTEILHIPHGAELELGDCRAPGTSPGGRWGSWCRARYGSAEGWVFDAFISR